MITSNAQEKDQTDIREMYVRIAVVKKINNDSVIALIDGGKRYGIKNGSVGIVKGVYKSGDDRSDFEIGYASVYKVTDTTAFVTIKPADKLGTKKGYDIRKGDYVILKVNVPKLTYRSIFFELALLDIQFNNLYNNSLYSIADLFYRDSKQLEDSLLIAGSKDVFETYDALKNDTSFKSLNEPLTEGRYKGRSIFGVMKDCNANDVFSFLHFVSNYPGKYIGHTWKLNETFATWVLNKAPYSKKEIYDSIMSYKNKPALLKVFITKNIALIKQKGFVTDWISDAATALNLKQTQKALNFFEAAKLVLPYLKDESITGFYYFNYAGYFEDLEKYNQVINYYDTAYSYYTKCNNDYFKTRILLSKGLTYSSMNKLDDAIATFDKMYADLSKADNQLTNSQKNIFYAQYHYYSGFVQAKKGELKKAVSHYEEAIKLYKSFNTYSSLNLAINVQGRLARLYKQQGELQKSLQIYTEQLELYTNLNDRKNIADVLDNIADIEFKLANYRKAIQQYSTAKDIHLSFEDYNSAGFSQSNIGQAFWNLGKYDSAIAAHQIALQYRSISKSYSGLGYTWKKIGALYKETGEKTKALSAYDSSAHYYSLGKDSSNLRSLLQDIGDVYYNDKQYQKSFQYYFKWHQLNIATKNKSDIVNSSYWLAWAAYDLKLIDTSKYYFNYCLNTAKDIGDKANQMYANLGLGSVAYKEYAYEEGEKYFNTALEIAIAEKNKKQEANGYKIKANAYATKLDFANALIYFNKSIALYDSLGEKTALPALYNNVANAYQIKGDFEESKKWYQKSIDNARKTNNKSEIGDAFSGLSFLYVLQGNLDLAQTAADSSEAVFKELNNNWQIAGSYITMGIVNNYKNNYNASVKYYLTADSLFTLEKDDWSRSTCLNNIGNVYYFQADYNNALKYFLESEKLLSKIKIVTESHILAKNNIGETYYYLKNYTKAEKYLLEGYALAKEKNIGRMLSSANIELGMLYFDTKKYAESEKYLMDGQTIAKKMNLLENIVASNMYLGKLFAAQNNVAKATQHFRDAIQLTNKNKSSKYDWELRYEFGLTFYNQQKYDSAIVYFKQAVELVDESAKNLFGGSEAKKIYSEDYRKVDLYNKLVAALVKTGKKEDALFYADKSNNQAVKEQMEKVGIVTDDKEKAEALQKGNELLQKKNAVEKAIAKEKAKPEKEQNKQLIASLESVKSVAESDYTNFIEDLQRKYQDLQAYFSNTNPKDFNRYIDDIPDSTIVVLYIINGNQLFIFTVTNKETGIKTIDLKQDLNKQATKFLSILRNPNNATGTGAVTLRSTLKKVEDVRGDFKSEATELYNLLITPIAEQLKDMKNICFIPNGKLSNIPFQCLGYNDEKKKFHFLVEDYAIFYTSKIDVFRNRFKKRNLESSLALFGNPDKTLPGATTEANAIARLVPGATVYIEEQATEDKAKDALAKFSYVHFATHGVLDYEKPENSYLLFAPGLGDNNEGKLTIAEINGVKKPTSSLVVLSACETAVSKEEVKGFYISPANAFLTNRVDAVIGSLWKVPDETTNLLLQEFYTNIEKKGMTKVEALRHAQAAVSENPKYSHPFFWSAFVLYGEWR
ncbi:MAG: CHAT domain-containing protein [Chitinophagaceae bacterium]|nr:CHAT domain-containing protein [Chitinophagaceae bacterium]